MFLYFSATPQQSGFVSLLRLHQNLKEVKSLASVAPAWFCHSQEAQQRLNYVPQPLQFLRLCEHEPDPLHLLSLAPLTETFATPATRPSAPGSNAVADSESQQLAPNP